MRICRSRYLCVLLLLLSSVSARVLAEQKAGFRGIGYLPGYTSSLAIDVSGDGSTVVGQLKGGPPPGPGYAAFKWTESDGMVNLGEISGPQMYYTTNAVSFDGSVVLGRYRHEIEMFQVFLWTLKDGMIPLGIDSTSLLMDLSADGSVVVGQYTQPFRWTKAGGIVYLGTMPGGNYSGGSYGVSADGNTIVGSGVSHLGPEGFRWTAATGRVGLGGLSGLNKTYPQAISADGSTIVGVSWSSPKTPEAFRWTKADGMVGLGFQTDSRGSEAYAVSADGAVVVGRNNTWQFIWDKANGMRVLRDVLVNDLGLDLTGWKLRAVTALSDDGLTIVGRGRNPKGYTEGWIATLPSTFFSASN